MLGEMDIWRVGVLGDSGVGKTALFTVNWHSDMYPPTDIHEPIGTMQDPYRRELEVDKRLCCVQGIETRGRDEPDTLHGQWLQECQAFLLVYSVTSRSTFDGLEAFRQRMINFTRRRPIFLLVGNKCDLQYARELSTEEGTALARQFDCEFIETSAKSLINVHSLFVNLVRSLRRPDPPVPKENKKKCVVV